MSDENIMRLWNDCGQGGKVRPRLRIVNKTASYTITPDDFGSVFTTRGGTTVTFTLPAASSKNTGEVVMFINVVNSNMLVASASAGGLVFKNDLAANSVAFSTTSEKIGGAFLAISDGTSWIVLPIAEEAQTVTVVT